MSNRCCDAVAVAAAAALVSRPLPFFFLVLMFCLDAFSLFFISLNHLFFFFFFLGGGYQGVTQASYRITVAVRTASGAAGSTLYWDSGDVASAAANEIEYSGQRLEPFTRYLWTAEWTPSAASGATAHSNHTTARSAAASATFETGPMRDADWGNALWLPGSHRQNLGLLRNDFTLPASAAGTTVAWARAYVASPGCAVLQVNGVVPSSPDYRGVCPWVVSGAALLRNTRYMVSNATHQSVSTG